MMDNIGKGAGLGSHTEGAFERFLTAAIATIITIMFSWRLLEEQQDQVDNGRPTKFRPQQIINPTKKPDKNDECDKHNKAIVGNSTSVSPSAEVSGISGSDDGTSKLATSEGSGPEYYCVSDDDDDSPTWANYSWEDDMYGGIHTRRTARDFISSAKTLKDSDKNSSPENSDISLPLSSQLLEEMYVNSEYRSAVEEAGSSMQFSDSSDDEGDDEEEEEGRDEGEFCFPPADENQVYCPQPLAPIIEEDSDDEYDDTDESETESECVRNHKVPDGLSEENFMDVKDSSNEEVVERILDNSEQPFDRDLTTVTEAEKQQEGNLNVNEIETKECGELDSKSDIITVSNRPENLTYFDSDEAEIMCNSPVRTCAIDDDENLSDESCSTCSSSASVLTVVSVNTWEINKAKEKLDSHPSGQACSTMPECEKVKDPTNQSLLAFIHNTENTPDDSCKADLTLPRKTANLTDDRDLNVQVQKDLEVTIPVDLHTTNEKQRTASDLDYDEFVKSINDQSEIRGDDEGNKIKENGRLSPIFAEETRNSLAYDSRFDDDVQPREYNPFEDDFCDFSEDSDDSDSFFMVVGNNGHLRNFETVNNLNIAGLSQPCEDLRTLMHSPNQSLVFTRTEDISIEHRSRYFTRERNADTENSAEYLNNINEIDLVIRESNEVVSDCLVISESPYPPADDREITTDTATIIGGRSEEDIIAIDEKTRLLNEANTASTKIDFTQLDNPSAVQTESILSYTTASLDKVDEDPERSRDKNLIQRADEGDEISEGEEGTPACDGQSLHISEEDLVLETECTAQQDELLNDQQENKLHEQHREEIADKTNNSNDTVAVVDNLPNSNINVSTRTYPNVTQTLEIKSELNAGSLTDDLKQSPTDPCSIEDEKVLDANSNVRDLLHIEEEAGYCDNYHSVEEIIPKSDSKSVETTLNAIDSGVGESDLEMMTRSKPIDQAVYDQNLEIWNKYLDKSAPSRVARTPLQKPSSFRRDAKGVKAKLTKHVPKRRPPSVYESVLLNPVSEPDRKTFVFELPKNVPLSRQKIFAMRHKFLSQESLAPSPMQDKFASHKASLSSLPRTGRYKKRELSSSRNSLRNSSIERIDHISSLYSSRVSCDESFEKRELHSLHENCMFSPAIHEEILNTTESIDNLDGSFSMSGSDMMRYSSMASLVETDIDTGETTETLFVYPDSDVDYDFDFQSSIKRAHSMSELGAKKQTKKTSRGRFADKNVAKSKSLQTLETNIDDVFTAKGEGNLARVPSVHELRVSKSLQKLNVPDWFKNSSFSRSGSTFSLYGSQQRRDSTSTMSSIGYPPSISSSACQSPLQQNPVVIRTRVTPPSAKFFRGPKLPMTPEKAPISPASISLPSDKFRNKEKPKELMPIPIVPFSQLRLMFEKSTDSRAADPAPVKPTVNAPVNAPSATSPTRPKHIPVTETKVPPSILKKTTPISPTIEDRSPMQLTEHFSNGELNHEPYKQRKPPGADQAVPKPQTVDKERIQKEEVTPQREIPDGSIPRGVQPKNASNKPAMVARPTPAPRQPKPTVAESAQSRKGERESTYNKTIHLLTFVY